MNYQNYAVYNLRPYFSTQPGHPKYCLYCGHDLSIMNIEPSLSVKDDLDHWNQLYTSHDFSLLHMCSHCDWWFVRESWSLNEYSMDLDYIIVGVATNDLIEVAEEKPWLKAMQDPEIYTHNTQTVPPAVAQVFQKLQNLDERTRK